MGQSVWDSVRVAILAKEVRKLLWGMIFDQRPACGEGARYSGEFNKTQRW
jgi:hypothetical protein